MTLAAVFPVMMLLLVASALVACVHALRRRQTALRTGLLACPTCCGRSTVEPDYPSGCLVAVCQRSTCGAIRRHPVRASALSLFGVMETATAAGAALAVAILAPRLGSQTTTLVTALLAFVVAGIAASLAVRLLATLGSRLPLLLQEELVAHLAPPPFQRRIG